MQISIVAAMSRNRVIGHQGSIPWRIRGEQQIFKRLTLGKALILGRKTYDSIGKSLPGRTTVVITRRENFSAPGVQVTQSVEDSLRVAEQLGLDVAIGGGAEIYNQTIALADRIYLTTVQADFEGDTFFPQLPVGLFALTSQEEFAASIPYTFSTFVRGNPDHRFESDASASKPNR